CEFDDGTVITPDTARRVACDASISRVVTRGESEILDVGRTTRTIPAAIRKALIIRDRHCQHRGCDRPHRWCDAHHITHWAHGGPTSLDNLTLLCRRHHRAAHQDDQAVARQ
ncbi:MAG: HNH endonuclease signature motif containing protein, partial [Acidimicrobiia bacterium]